MLAETENILKIKNPVDWYRISEDQLHKLKVKYLLTRQYGSIFETLKKYRPEFNWDETKFIGVSFSGNKMLGASLRKIFPNLEIIENYILPNSDSIKVSFFIPNLNIAFDYQKDREYGLSSSSGICYLKLQVDGQKLSLAKINNISLIFIPFWWDRTLESLITTISLNISNFSVETILKDIGDYDSKKLVPIPDEAQVNLSRWKTRR